MFCVSLSLSKALDEAAALKGWREVRGAVFVCVCVCGCVAIRAE